MNRFTFTVTETVAITKTYTVEAETEELARAKAEIGDTVAEEAAPYLAEAEVIGRAVWAD